jgi:hypothetical protein
MPEKKKPIEMTTEEAMKELFPSKVVRKLKEVAHGKKYLSKKTVTRQAVNQNRKRNST